MYILTQNFGRVLIAHGNHIGNFVHFGHLLLMQKHPFRRSRKPCIPGTYILAYIYVYKSIFTYIHTYIYIHKYTYISIHTCITGCDLPEGWGVQPTLLYCLTLCQYIINSSCMHVFTCSTPTFLGKNNTLHAYLHKYINTYIHLVSCLSCCLSICLFGCVFVSVYVEKLLLVLSSYVGDISRITYCMSYVLFLPTFPMPFICYNELSQKTEAAHLT